jgi:chromosome segregation ATPase
MVVPVQNLKKAETDIAVLQVQVQNIEDKIDDIKQDMRDMRDDVSKSNNELRDMLKEMKTQDNTAHLEISKKVSGLEKWRWMLMGAGIVIGSMGFEWLAKLLK